MNAYRSARQRAGMSQTQAAKKTELTQEAISRIERGVRNPRVSTAVKLAKAYGISVDELIGHAKQAS